LPEKSSTHSVGLDAEHGEHARAIFGERSDLHIPFSLRKTIFHMVDSARGGKVGDGELILADAARGTYNVSWSCKNWL
jgi:hypothetical protein